MTKPVPPTARPYETSRGAVGGRAQPAVLVAGASASLRDWRCGCDDGTVGAKLGHIIHSGTALRPDGVALGCAPLAPRTLSPTMPPKAPTPMHAGTPETSGGGSIGSSIKAILVGGTERRRHRGKGGH